LKTFDELRSQWGEPLDRENLADMPSGFDGDYPSFNFIHDIMTREVQS